MAPRSLKTIETALLLGVSVCLVFSEIVCVSSEIKAFYCRRLDGYGPGMHILSKFSLL